MLAHMRLGHVALLHIHISIRWDSPFDIDGADLLAAYEKKIFHAMKFYWDMVEEFYTTPFMELFMQPRNNHRLPDAIVAVLAGELEGGWKISWRLRLFFFLVKLQTRWPLVPRISYSESVATRAEARL